MLDKTDKQILKILQEQGRITNRELANMVKLSEASVLTRVRRLEEEKYICGYHAKLNPEKIGYEIVLYVEITLKHNNTEEFAEFEKTVRDCKHILRCYLMTGTCDYLIKVRAKSMKEYRKIAMDILWKLPGVAEIQTCPVVAEIKTDDKLMI